MKHHTHDAGWLHNELADWIRNENWPKVEDTCGQLITLAKQAEADRQKAAANGSMAAMLNPYPKGRWN